MPELPEVETIVRGLKGLLPGKKLENISIFSRTLRYPLEKNRLRKLKGQKLLAIQRRAKYIIFDFEVAWLLISLGMTGKFVFREKQIKHDHLCFTFGQDKLFYNDVRRFGFIRYYQEKPQLNTGIEPLSKAFTVDFFFNKIKDSKREIKNILLSGFPVCGVGNIYASESLFQAGIHPQTTSMNRKKSSLLVKSIRDVLKRSIRAGGTTLKDYKNIKDSPGYFALQLSVYGRNGQACKRCEAIITKIVQSGRSTFFCPSCQKR
ncbi:bifunctional DNA-formamidopyrimidine glycosylase/DNA-(apurinic or apyrimidinic site) lyase [Candidatus Riflebacteria bacterium]